MKFFFQKMYRGLIIIYLSILNLILEIVFIKKLYNYLEKKLFTYKSWIIGYCIICNDFTKFNNFSQNLRETISCVKCGSFNRQRQLFLNIKKFLGNSLNDLCVHNTESYGALHKILRKTCTNYTFSEYFSSDKSFINNIRNENLEKLNFQNESLDLIITSDVLEHVAKPYDAFREIHRVLKPKAYHIFTVPFDLNSPNDIKKAEMINGKVQIYGEPEYHEDTLKKEGALVFNIFGDEMIKKLDQIGLKTLMDRPIFPFFGMIGSGNIVFISQKK